MTKSVKWAAQLHGVLEVSLLGTADLGFWQARLADEQLTPAQREGRAVISIVSAAGRFAGVRFREWSVSVVVSSAAGSAETPAYFLVGAFTSNRFFAFCERFFFSTPYDHANVDVNSSDPTEIRVTRQGRTLFHAYMPGAACNRPAQLREESWTAPVLLPSTRRTAGRPKKMFFARIFGATEVFPFHPDDDRISLCKQGDGDLFDALLKSSFTPVEWIVRRNASHAKSKTYDRD